jgi:hypothetical protein
MRLLSWAPMGGGMIAEKKNELRAVNVVASWSAPPREMSPPE